MLLIPLSLFYLLFIGSLYGKVRSVSGADCENSIHVFSDLDNLLHYLLNLPHVSLIVANSLNLIN